ncbi:MAG TPA: protein kinase [Thermoanaerobaculia bacterium]|nr:protein kinase [Thermoanaerobaculia bacterium]
MSSNLQDQLQRALGEAYLLERELGGGGMSRVFLAHERALGRKVVVKVLLPELSAGVNVERFRREIQLAAQLQHPHIVPLLSAGEADGLPYFIMPFVTGESLRARVAREGEFPISETVRILRDVVSALAYAHGYGVIHRDVKPDNVLLSGGVAVVTDFGVAKAVTASAGESGSTGLTSLGVALGTPAYMAPEQATASPNTDHRADIYSLGIVAYEMLTGTPPFGGRSAQQVLAAQVVEEPEPVERRRPAVPPLLATLVRDCLAKRPADRPQTAAHVMHLLDAIATPSGGTAATTAVRMPAHAKPTARRWRWPIAALVSGLVVLLAGGALWLRRTVPATAPGPSATADSTVPPRAPAAPIAVAPPAPLPSAVASEPPRPNTTRRDRTARSRTPRPSAPIAQESLPATSTVEPPAATESVPLPAGALLPPVAAPPAPPSPAVTAPTPAPKPADPAPEIRGVVGEYADAIEAKSLPGLQRVYPGMTGLQARGWEQFFQLVRDVKARLSVAGLDVSGGTADAQVTGTYTYLNTSTGRTESQPVAFHASFRNEGGKWRMSQVR